jgi:ABC-type Fe3+/spermidine/putrescine transport system ATPase subunit
MALEVSDLAVKYSEHVILDGLSLTADRGSIVGILGFSASGKTTLIRAIAGLAPVDRGDIRIDGKSIRTLPTNKRRIGFMHQDFALFDDYTVLENISFGLKYKKGTTDLSGHLEHLVDALDLKGTQGLYPGHLSGGQKQRVALARCLTPLPRLILLDEPLSQLDPPLRSRAREMMLRLFLEHGSTVLLVSHDIEDCLDLCDQIAILDDKRIVETGAPATLIADPQNLASALLTGHLNIIRADSLTKKNEGALCEAATDHGLVLIGKCAPHHGIAAQQIVWGARPWALSVREGPNNLFLGEGKILRRYRTERSVVYQTQLKDTSLTLRIETSDLNIPEGDIVRIYYDPEKAKFFSRRESLNV